MIRKFRTKKVQNSHESCFVSKQPTSLKYNFYTVSFISENWIIAINNKQWVFQMQLILLRQIHSCAICLVPIFCWVNFEWQTVARNLFTSPLHYTIIHWCLVFWWCLHEKWNQLRTECRLNGISIIYSISSKMILVMKFPKFFFKCYSEIHHCSTPIHLEIVYIWSCLNELTFHN